jgi:hypothetical protein
MLSYTHLKELAAGGESRRASKGLKMNFVEKLTASSVGTELSMRSASGKSFRVKKEAFDSFSVRVLSKTGSWLQCSGGSADDLARRYPFASFDCLGVSK